MAKKSRAIAFILIFVLLLNGITNVFQPKWLDKTCDTLVADHYREIPKNKIEMLFLGSSQMTYGIDSIKIYQDYGIYPYVLSGSNNPMMVCYYQLLDINKKHKNIKSVVLDASVLYEVCNKSNYHKNIDNMKLSTNKIKAIYDYCTKIYEPENNDPDKFNTFFSFLFRFIEYHSRWSEFTKDDIDYSKYDKNFYLGNTVVLKAWHPDIDKKKFFVDYDTKADNDKELNTVEADYFQRIITYCKDNDIRLTLIKTPKNSWTKAGHEYVQKVADENQIEFYDFNIEKMANEMGFDYETDLMDKDHLNIFGAQKLTKFLLDNLAPLDEYTDYRKTNEISKSMLKEYEKNIDLTKYTDSKNIAEIFKFANNENYTVIIESSADISNIWTDEYQKALEELGCDFNVKELKGKNYLFIKDGANIIESKVSDKPIAYKGVVPKDKEYSLISDIKTPENESSITIKDKNYKYFRNGMNIVIYDNKGKKFKFRATIYNNNGKADVRVIY